jgi:hypothetical protein
MTAYTPGALSSSMSTTPENVPTALNMAGCREATAVDE